MRFLLKVSWCLFATALLAAAGCQSKLNVEKSVTIPRLTSVPVEVHGPTKDQVVSVEISSPVKINVYVFLKMDAEMVKQKIDGKIVEEVHRPKLPSKILYSKEKTEQDSFQVTIPAGKDFYVLLSSVSTKDIDVKVKLHGS